MTGIELIAQERNEQLTKHGRTVELEKILPCPFCGSEADITFTGNDHTSKRRAIIQCENINCRATISGATINHKTQWIATAIVKTWNTRV